MITEKNVIEENMPISSERFFSLLLNLETKKEGKWSQTFILPGAAPHIKLMWRKL